MNLTSSEENGKNARPVSGIVNPSLRDGMGHQPRGPSGDKHEMRAAQRFLLSRAAIQSHRHAQLYGPRGSAAGRTWGGF